MGIDRLNRLAVLMCSVGLMTLSACGGDDDNTPPPPATTDVSTTVIDGAIGNALVCLDTNDNGACDAGEVSGRTDATGKVTLTVPQADAGKHALVAVIGTDAVDADTGPVTTAYTMSAPADQTAVVSPLTTLVQQTIASSGLSTTDAAAAVQATTGITTSLFQNYTTATAPTDGTANPAVVARMVVVTTQQQASTVASTLGTPAVDGKTITQADLDRAVRDKVLELLADLVAALSDPAVVAATTPSDKTAALLAAATALVTSSGLTPAAVPTTVAINTQNANPPVVAAQPPSASAGIDTLNFSDASNYFLRVLGSSLAQNTPDASNMTKFVERRRRVSAGQVATWGSGSDPWRNNDVSWDGSAWVTCSINYENTSSVRDAQGNSSYNYCGRELGKSNRATIDIAGKTMAEVYAQIVAAGFTNYTIANATTALGSATFPANSALFYQTNTPYSESISYLSAGATSPPGFAGGAVSQYSSEVSSGGNGSTQPAGTGCNSAETATNGSTSTTLEGLIASKSGTPCIFGQGSITYNGVTYQSDPSNEWWGNSTLSLGTLGSVSTTPSTSSTGYYTPNTLLRVAFIGSGANAVTYYACKQRYNGGSVRNCTSIGTGTYAITTLGDGRALTFTNPPLQAAALTYNRVFVERGGIVYFGYQSKPAVTRKARLNTTASNALLAQLGVTPENPEVPLALTAGSYQGTWDIRDATLPISPTAGFTVFVNGNGTSSCQSRSNGAAFACTVTITNPATGAYTLSGNGTYNGIFDFMAGTTAGSYDSGNFVGARR